MRTLVAIQSRVPALSFSRRIRCGSAACFVFRGTSDRPVERRRQAAGGGGLEDFAASPGTFVGHRGPAPGLARLRFVWSLPIHFTRSAAWEQGARAGGLSTAAGHKTAGAVPKPSEARVFDDFGVELEGLTLDRADARLGRASSSAGGDRPASSAGDDRTRWPTRPKPGRRWDLRSRRAPRAAAGAASTLRARADRPRPRNREYSWRRQKRSWKRRAALRVTSRQPCGSIFRASSKR